MKEVWIMLFLLFPAGQEGLVTGWQKPHATKVACEVAKVEAMKEAMKVRGVKTIPFATCERVK